MRLFGLDGRQLEDLPVPLAFIPDAIPQTRGVRQNLGFESAATVGPYFYTGSEGALVQDGPAAGIGVPSPARLLRYNLKTGRPDRQYVYVTDPIAEPPVPPTNFAVNGLVELLPLDKHSFLSMERSFSVGAPDTGNTIKLYTVEISGAQNVNGREKLTGTEEPVTKELLLNLRRARDPARQRRGHGLRARPRRRAALARPRQRQQLRARAVHAVPALRVLREVSWVAIGVPIDSVGRAGGTEHAPAALRRAGLVERLGIADRGDLDVRIRGEERDAETGIVGSPDVLAMTGVVREAIREMVAAGERPLVLGGCCSLVPGALAGVRDAAGAVGIASVDGHVDVYDGETSPTGEGADMPLAVAFGLGPAGWVDASGGPSTDPGKAVILGARDPEEAEDIAPLLAGELADLLVLSPGDLRSRGLRPSRRAGRRAAGGACGPLLDPPGRGRPRRTGHACDRLPHAGRARVGRARRGARAALRLARRRGPQHRLRQPGEGSGRQSHAANQRCGRRRSSNPDRAAPRKTRARRVVSVVGRRGFCMQLRRLIAVLALVAVFAALLVATPAAATGDTATKCAAYAVLKPGNEVPPTASKTFGAAAIHINGTTLSFAVTIANPQRETFIAGHIHIGAAGVNGPVRQLLFSGSNDRKLFFQAAQIQISEANAELICGDLAGHYVNYHTTTFPGGALRGQLIGG